MADAAQALVELGAKRVVDREPLVPWGRAEQRVVHAVDAPELDERLRVVVDPEVDEDVGEAGVPTVALDDEERRRLAPPAVTARGLGGVEAVEQALGEAVPCGCLERLGERIDGL